MSPDARNAWLRTLGQLALVLALGLGVGLLVGQPWPVLTVAALGVVAWHYWKLRNVLLIRDPREVVASYVKSRAHVEPDDIGLRQQVQLHDELAASGDAPPVIDSGDFLRAPEAHLRALCAWLGIDFSDRMLHWPKGPRASDGIWAPHWYAHVWESTGFEAPQPRTIELTAEAAAVAEACLPHYRHLHALRMRLD